MVLELKPEQNLWFCYGANKIGRLSPEAIAPAAPKQKLPN